MRIVSGEAMNASARPVRRIAQASALSLGALFRQGYRDLCRSDQQSATGESNFKFCEFHRELHRLEGR